MNKLLTHMP